MKYTPDTANVMFNDVGVRVDIKVPHYRYVDSVLSRNSYEELMWLFTRATSSTKEISESYAALNNLKKVCDVSKYSWLHIGDGAYARTTGLFTFLTKSENYAIDPAINRERLSSWVEKYNVQRFHFSKTKFEDENGILEKISRPYGIACVHAHVNLEEVDKKYPDWEFLYTNPCCMPGTQKFSEKYMKENNIVEVIHRVDYGILSNLREVIVYKKIK